MFARVAARNHNNTNSKPQTRCEEWGPGGGGGVEKPLTTGLVALHWVCVVALIYSQDASKTSVVEAFESSYMLSL